MYFPATHEGSFKNSIIGSVEKQFAVQQSRKPNALVEEYNSQTVKSLDPKTASSYTKSGMLHINKVLKSKNKTWLFVTGEILSHHHRASR